MEWNAQNGGISKAAKDTSMLPSKFDQKKVHPETGSEAEFVFRHVLPWNAASEGSILELSDAAELALNHWFTRFVQNADSFSN